MEYSVVDFASRLQPTQGLSLRVRWGESLLNSDRERVRGRETKRVRWRDRERRLYKVKRERDLINITQFFNTVRKFLTFYEVVNFL